MSRGLVKNIGWEGLIRAVDKQAHEAWRIPAAACPWCGEELGGNNGEHVKSERKELVEVVRVLSKKFALDPLEWTVGMLLVSNPSASDRVIADQIGISKTKANEARRRLREICPRLAELSAAYDRTVLAQNGRRKKEGKARQAPPPLVGTLTGRVQSRFAQRARYSRTQGDGNSGKHTGDVDDGV